MNFTWKDKGERVSKGTLTNLKERAQVLTIVYKTGEGYVNGTIGKVISISDDMIRIEVDSREGRHTCDVCRHIWENFRYHYVREEHRVVREKIGTFTQFPLKLAWSITVHKSQGLTFNAVTLDIWGGAFIPEYAQQMSRLILMPGSFILVIFKIIPINLAFSGQLVSGLYFPSALD